MDFVRKQTYLTPEQDRGLKQLAQRHHTSEADILRRAIDSWLARELRRDGDPFEGLIGMVDGPVEVLHDDIYG